MPDTFTVCASGIAGPGISGMRVQILEGQEKEARSWHFIKKGPSKMHLKNLFFFMYDELESKVSCLKSHV